MPVAFVFPRSIHEHLSTGMGVAAGTSRTHFAVVVMPVSAVLSTLGRLSLT